MSVLMMWTIYAWGTDGVDAYTIRRWRCAASGVTEDSDAMTFIDLDLMRAELSGMGLTMLTRSPEDEPHILETWL